MDLALNETQLMLQSMAREFLSNEVPKTVVRAIDESPTGFSVELWQKIADLGWAGMAVAEEHGGTGNPLADLAPVFEALGEAACPSPLLSQVFAAHLIQGVATPNQQAALLFCARKKPLAHEQNCFLAPDHISARANGGPRLAQDEYVLAQQEGRLLTRVLKKIFLCRKSTFFPF